DLGPSDVLFERIGDVEGKPLGEGLAAFRWKEGRRSATLSAQGVRGQGTVCDGVRQQERRVRRHDAVARRESGHLFDEFFIGSLLAAKLRQQVIDLAGRPQSWYE